MLGRFRCWVGYHTPGPVVNDGRDYWVSHCVRCGLLLTGPEKGDR